MDLLLRELYEALMPITRLIVRQDLPEYMDALEDRDAKLIVDKVLKVMAAHLRETL